MTHIEDAPAVEHMLAGRLDLGLLGQALLNLPLVSTQLGHATLAESDIYLHPSSLEGQFVADVVSSAKGELRREAFTEKWFGGDTGALELLLRIQEAHS